MTTAGESHGPGLVAVIEGLPAGLEIDREDLDLDLRRRQLGHGRGGRMKIESDRAEVTAGLRHGKTLGSPVAIRIINKDFENWKERMDPWSIDKEIEEVHLPRPGHADLAGSMKFGHSDIRNVLERASARETAARVAAGSCARVFLKGLGVTVHSHVLQIGRVGVDIDPQSPDDFEGVDESPVRCIDKSKAEEMVREIDEMRGRNESLGGVMEVRAFGLPPGLGSCSSWPDRLDGRLAQALMSIQSVKGVAIGEGFDVAGIPGSEAHDEIFYDDDVGYHRETNRAGGVEGGMTNGEPLVAKAALKPIPTLTQPLRSVDTETKEEAKALRERTDSCVVPAAGVIGEAMIAITLVGAIKEKFGGDHIDDVISALARYKERIGWRR